MASVNGGLQMTSTPNSDLQMVIASQVAYLDIPAKGMSVDELVMRVLRDCDGATGGKAKNQYETAKYLQGLLEKSPDCGSWVVRDSMNDNCNSGCCACLIDTGDGNAIMGFRGSESFDMSSSVKDWAENDFGMINKSLTPQQYVAEQFTKDMYEKYGNDYKSFDFTGHSLGGNLAEHATFMAPDGMNIGRCVNLDGPGFSQEYLAAHSEQIARNGKYVDHLQWSFVGSLLFPAPGTNFRVVDASGDGLTRHHTAHLVDKLDENGNAVDGDADALAAVTGPLSKDIERKSNEPGWEWLDDLVAKTGYIIAFVLAIKSEAEKALKELVIGIKNGLAEAWKGITEFCDAVGNWFRGLFGGESLTGVFEINYGRVNQLGMEIENAQWEFYNIGNEVIRIKDGLKYNSCSGSYYKSKLCRIGTDIQGLGDKAGKLASAAFTTVRFAQEDDNKAVSCYAIV